jgi:KDO2-lipid IV(A) lauroyltransferase
LLFVIPCRARSTTLTNLQICFPQKSALEIRALAKKSLISTAFTALEMGKVWVPPIGHTLSLVSQAEGLERFYEAINSDKGVILLAPHIGHWELFGLYLCNKLDATFMYQPPKLKRMDGLIKKVRGRAGLNLVPTDRKGVSQLLDRLNKGGLVGVLPDQVPTSVGGEYALFFGQPAFTMTLASKLARRTGARVFFGFALRLQNAAGFKIIVNEADAAIHSADLMTSTTAVNQMVERCVAVDISQYQWEYKRFRRQPNEVKFY